MDNLDFSALSDDQLLALLRATLQECVARNPAVEAAARAAVIDESERARIVASASAAEAAKLRAMERERIAKEAAARVRQEQEATLAAGEKARREAAAREALAKAEKKECNQKQWLARAAELVGRAAHDVTIVCLHDTYNDSSKTRVLINAGGSSRYSRDHLADYSQSTNKLSTKQSLVGKKKDLLAFCAELAASPQGVLSGSEFAW